MSHFTVLVVGENPEQQLAPFQENNMGDCPKPFLKFHDVEEEYTAQYATDECSVFISPDGTMYSKYDDRFRVFGEGFSTNYVCPDGWSEKEVSVMEMYPTFENYMENYCGYERRDEVIGKYGYWENPNAKWDWYSLGGRWTGYFKVKTIKSLGTSQIFDSYNGFTAAEMERFVDMKQNEPKKFAKVMSKYKNKDLETKIAELSVKVDHYFDHVQGEPGIMTSAAKEGYADQLRKKHIDIEGMRAESQEKAYAEYDKVASFFPTGIPKLDVIWEDLLKEDGISINEKRDIYNTQSGMLEWEKVIDAITDKDDRRFMVWRSLSDYQITREEYANNAAKSCLSTFAVVKDGVWYERGEMGWWGVVSNEKDKSDWDSEFEKLLSDLSDDTLVSIYDCHI